MHASEFPHNSRLTCSYGVVYVNHIGLPVPSVVVWYSQCWVKSNSLDWAMKLEETKKWGCSRSTLKPDGYWGLCWVHLLEDTHIQWAKANLHKICHNSTHHCWSKPEEHVGIWPYCDESRVTLKWVIFYAIQGVNYCWELPTSFYITTVNVWCEVEWFTCIFPEINLFNCRLSHTYFKSLTIPVGRPDVWMLSWKEGVGRQCANSTYQKEERDGQLHVCNTVSCQLGLLKRQARGGWGQDSGCIVCNLGLDSMIWWDDLEHFLLHSRN